MNVPSTLVLENDDWIHRNGEEWIREKFGDFIKLNPNIEDRHWVEYETNRFHMMLSQPFVKTVVVVSTFQMKVPVPTKNDKYENITQLEYYSRFIQDIDSFRKRLGYPPIEYHIVYINGVPFIDELKGGYLGETTYKNINKFAYQEPERFKVHIYNSDFEFEHTLTEELLKK